MRESDLSRVIMRTFWNTISETHISEVFQLSDEYENAIEPAKNPGERSVRKTAASQAFMRASTALEPSHTLSNESPFEIAILTELAPAREKSNTNWALCCGTIL